MRRSMSGRHVDGHDYMWAVSELIDRAQQAIFILDWWLSPELVCYPSYS
jgi:phosphatidylserine/phosphatidylglycerophosphate/cardiolipin synthase-like enzyme